MIKRQLDPKRVAWQKPGTVVRQLGLRRGDVVAEIGSGPGYFTTRLARAVGPSGHVYAVDPEPALLAALRDRLDGVGNVTPVLGRGDDPLLPPARCHLALIVNAYHHFEKRVSYLRRWRGCSRPAGVWSTSTGTRARRRSARRCERRIPRDAFLRDARRAGLTLVAEHRFLPYQYFLVLRRRR